MLCCFTAKSRKRKCVKMDGQTSNIINKKWIKWMRVLAPSLPTPHLLAFNFDMFHLPCVLDLSALESENLQVVVQAPGNAFVPHS